jgi:PTH1 family peptidyl-tRNA hydrolase
MMKLMVGLGNPGRIYSGTRHNIGFTVVRGLSQAYKISLKKESRIPALSGKFRISGAEVILALPLTYMNLSGVAVAGLLKKYKIEARNLLVVLDDLDLELGRIKLRPCGSSAGQRGLQSIIASLGTKEFARLRVGIGRPAKAQEASEYVLAPFKAAEKEKIAQVLQEAQDCCLAWVNQGISRAMGTFNKKEK